MNKNTIKLGMVVLMLIVVASYFISGTYARYASDFSGNASVTVAKWAVKLNESEEDDITFTVEENENVVADRIAPSVKATANAILDLNETEVAVDVIVEKGAEFDNKISDLGLDPTQVEFKMEKETGGNTTVTGEISGQGTTKEPFVVKLPEGGASALDGTLGIKLSIEWKNLDTDEMNVKDTDLGKLGGAEGSKKFELPVTVKVQQHIDAE